MSANGTCTSLHQRECSALTWCLDHARMHRKTMLHNMHRSTLAAWCSAESFCTCQDQHLTCQHVKSTHTAAAVLALALTLVLVKIPIPAVLLLVHLTQTQLQ